MFDGTMRVTPLPESMSRKQQTNVLPLNGEIDLHVSPDVADSLRTMIEKKPNQIVVDLTKVTYLDSSGLAVLIEGMQNVQKYGGTIGLVRVQGGRTDVSDND